MAGKRNGQQKAEQLAERLQHLERQVAGMQLAACAGAPRIDMPRMHISEDDAFFIGLAAGLTVAGLVLLLAS